MTKKDLVDAVAAKTKRTKILSEELVYAVFDVISEELASGGEVKVTGFGKFEVVDRAARTGRNPKTLEMIPVAAKKAPKFTPGKELKDMVCGSVG